MLKLGKKQRLSIIKTEPFGVYLAEFMPKKGENLSDVEKVLLPIKQVPKDFKPRLFFGEFFGNADKVERKGKIAWRDMIFVDSQVVRDMTIGCSKDPERKLFYKWVKDFIQLVMEDEERCWRYECVMMKRICYDPLKKPIDIRYAVDGLYINDTRIN